MYTDICTDVKKPDKTPAQDYQLSLSLSLVLVCVSVIKPNASRCAG